MHSIRRLVASRQIASLALPRASASTQLRSISRLAAAPSAWTRPVNASVSQRWYSEKASEEQSKPEQATEVSEVDSLKKQIEAKEKEVIDLKDKYLRSVADFRNLQERIKREVQSARDFAIQKFAKDLTESIDNLDRALGMITPDKLVSKDKVASMPAEETAKVYQEAHSDLLALHEGLKMTDDIMMSTLAKHGLVRTDPARDGEVFDPNRHEATFMAPQPGKEDGIVFHTQQKGFVLNGRTLRAAKVGVVKNS